MGKQNGCTVWFTGLPCSGKTTVCKKVQEILQGQGYQVELLDGDELRKHFSAGVGFSKEDRSNHLKRVSFLAHLLSKHGVIVLASFVSPYRENRDYARQLIGERFFEVFADAPLEACIKRDVKGMYKKALAGEIKDFTGVQDPYEPPLAPELTIKTNDEPLERSVEHVLAFLRARNVLSNGATARV
jgi:adenylylsulfate kinase